MKKGHADTKVQRPNEVRSSLSPAAVRLNVRVTPRSSRNELISYRDGVLSIRVSAPPVESAANESCRALIAELVGVRASQVTIVGGAHSRNKVVEVEGLDALVVEERLRERDICA